MLKIFSFLIIFLLININISAEEICSDYTPELILNIGGTSDPEKIIYAKNNYECKKKIDLCEINGCLLEIFDHKGNLLKSFAVKNDWFVRPKNDLSTETTYELVIPIKNHIQKILFIENAKLSYKLERTFKGYRDDFINNYQVKTGIIQRYKKMLLDTDANINLKSHRWSGKCFVMWENEILVDDQKCFMQTNHGPIELFDDFIVVVMKDDIICEDVTSKSCNFFFKVQQYKHEGSFYWNVYFQGKTIGSDAHMYIPLRSHQTSENGSCFFRKTKKDQNKKDTEIKDKFCFVHDGDSISNIF
ncbi:hypothetical protein [Candidatus Pelagibacter sp. HIMB1715]|uniref:hypothetical protein n=1 Tax=Candidatus Pelagibacter sp. HIMB1715 TaxID=3413369 RepID=UPI003F851861